MAALSNAKYFHLPISRLTSNKIRQGKRYLAFTYDGIVLSHPEIVTLGMHPIDILVAPIQHWHVGSIKAFIPPLLDGFLVEVLRLGCENDMWDLRFVQRIEEIIALRIELSSSRLVHPRMYACFVATLTQGVSNADFCCAIAFNTSSIG